MKTARYDEFQLANRHRIAFQTLIITFLMIMINGYVKFFYGVWAEPMLEMLVMIIIPVMYFTIMSTAKNAYLGQKDQPTTFIVAMGIAATFSGISVISYITSGMFALVEGGQLTNQVGNLLLFLFTGGTAVAQITRRMINKRMLEKEV